MTRRYRISGITIQTETRWRMMNNLTFRIQTASTRARFHALIVYTCFIPRAVRVLHALGTTTQIRIAEIIRLAYARAGAVKFFAYGVRSARRRYARFGLGGRYNNWNCGNTLSLRGIQDRARTSKKKTRERDDHPRTRLTWK